MSHTPEQLRHDALEIWRAAVDGVRADRLVAHAIHVDGHHLRIGDETMDLDSIDRMVVVGAGKGGAGMAAGVEQALGANVCQQKKLSGWVNVPADCVRPLEFIHLHGARPAGLNQPTPDGEHGAREMLQLVASLGPRDLCLALVSGGGSALLPAPPTGITLADKRAIAELLSARGADIRQLNLVRKHLSDIKGGGLARACGAGHLVSLIISDVLGDPLDLIASGPTVPDTSDAGEALEILDRFEAREAGISSRVFEYLQLQRKVARPPRPTCKLTHLVIGGNTTAVAAAAHHARRLGYEPQPFSADEPEGSAEEVGQQLAVAALEMRSRPGPPCLISGGEPTVRLRPAGERGHGGRNQQLVLAAAQHFSHAGQKGAGIVLLSGGTDGEDGPTDAAGAVVDAEILRAAETAGLNPQEYLRRNDAYHFFEPLGALIKTGPTHTNVCDIRVVLTERTPG